MLNSTGHWELSVQKNLVDAERKSLSFEDDDVIIAISRNQCTRCNRSMIDLVNRFRSSNRKVTVIRLLDSALMECKKDEIFFKDEYPDLPFEYVSDHILRLVRNDKDSVHVTVDKTPVLITLGKKPKIYDSDALVDEYGRLQAAKFN